MGSMHVLHVVGARPNFMKAAPVLSALARRGLRQTLVHTGQHYDANMSDVFFQQLELPAPDVNLEVGSGSHAVQTAQIMMRFEDEVLSRRPDLVLVYGDVNSTIAASLVCAKLMLPVGHVEAGLRSFDRRMPEEINRLLTDQISELLFTPSRDADENLLREGVAAGKIHLAGNVMIDTLVRLLPKAEQESRDCPSEPFALVTLHRPSNVDEPGMLKRIVESLVTISRDLTVIFPVHPRTRQRISGGGVSISENGRLRLMEPMPYLHFLSLQRHATVVITDSGGIQEETTYLGVPCLTVRENTERPVTTTLGTNILVGEDMQRLESEVKRILAGKGKQGQVPPLWDGHAAERIADVVRSWEHRK
jgi:UDP-N-acetylglucosamine 2-epimerase (non-hydrolysing)